MEFSLNPGVVVLLLVLLALYVRAVRVARERGLEVPRRQQLAFYAGLALWTGALAGPVDAYSKDLLSAHMAQHLLLAELGAPLILVGVRAPVVYFLLPRPALVTLARRRRLRDLVRFLSKPLAAIAVYLVVLYGWHFALLFEAATENELIHALQHQSFVLISVLVWLPALEPTRRRVPGELWKAGHIVGARLVGMFLGMAFIVMRSPAYPLYAERAPEHGLSGLADQQIAGGMMLSLDAVIMLTAIGYFFWRSAQDHDLQEARERAAAGPPQRVV